MKGMPPMMDKMTPPMGGLNALPPLPKKGKGKAKPKAKTKKRSAK